MEWPARDGDSPVIEIEADRSRYPSIAGHVQSGENPRGPSRKAKYYLTTDSELSRATERWEEPLLGEDSEPETMCLQAIGGLCPFSGKCLTVCLLHNDPASCR